MRVPRRTPADGSTAAPPAPAPRRRVRLALRTRLTLLYAGLFAGTTAVVLAVTYVVVRDHLRSTLTPGSADAIMDQLAGSLGLALLGTTLLAAGLGWLLARRLLAPLGAITDAARRASEERLDERVGHDGPADEVHDLAESFDAMLDRFRASIGAQRRFVANASHELRTPLTAIRTEVDVTLGDPDADAAELRRMGERVLVGADELEALLEALLVLARSQQGAGARREVAFADAARLALVDALDPHVGSAGAGVPPVVDDAASEPLATPEGHEVRWTADAVAVDGDPSLLRRLAANLLDNARRYNRPGGWIRMDVGPAVRDGRTVAVLRVRNSGPVVAADDLPRLGEPFERLGRRHGDGTGLGLSIVRAVAEAHGGSVRFRAGDDGGLDVRVELPGRATSGDATPAPGESPLLTRV